MTRPQVIEALRYEISLPPVAAGQRLINERQLAQLLGANRMTVRRSLDDLEKQGLIIRRQGSGTYIRKIPTQAACPVGYVPIDGAICVADDSDDQPTRLQPDPARQQLTIGVFGDMLCTSPANVLLLEGITQRITELNHRMQLYQLEYEADGVTPIEHVADDIVNTPCDGYIVNSHMVDLFLNAYRKICHKDSPPMVHVWPGSLLPAYEPLIQSDTQQSVERATRKLIEQGHRRILLVGFSGVRSLPSRELMGYQLAMQDAGLPLMPQLTVNDLRHLAKTWRPTFEKYLDENELPDALCMATDEPLGVLYEILKERGIKPGRDLGLITVANEGLDLPDGEDWSAMVFDPHLVGSMAVSSLVDVIITAGQKLCSYSHQAHWYCGTTHLRQ